MATTATQEQVNQINAKSIIGLKPKMLDHGRAQAFIGDPEALDRFAEFINSYERRRTYPVIEITSIAEPTFPDWSRGRILTGDIRRPKEIDFVSVMSSAYFHSRQTGEDNRPLGHEILASLIASYKASEDKNGNIYDVSESDLIHGHFGLAELTYMEKNRSTLPEPFKAWAKGKLLYGWRDVVRRDDGNLSVPCLSCRVDRPCVVWCGLGSSWHGNEPALREQVNTQS